MSAATPSSDSQPTRRRKLEAMLAQNPNDSFLAYGLALEYLKEGERAEGISRLKTLIERDPDYQAAYFQLGQTLAEIGDIEEARAWLRKGIDAARRIGNDHAAGEMSAFLDML